MAQIICRDLSFAYDGETVLSDINFSLDAGSYLCIVGEDEEDEDYEFEAEDETDAGEDEEK